MYITSKWKKVCLPSHHNSEDIIITEVIEVTDYFNSPYMQSSFMKAIQCSAYAVFNVWQAQI